MTLRKRIMRWHGRTAWPTFHCQDCMGSGNYGCWCDTLGCIAPNTPPFPWHEFMRWLYHYLWQ